MVREKFDNRNLHKNISSISYPDSPAKRRMTIALLESLKDTSLVARELQRLLKEDQNNNSLNLKQK